MKLKEMKYYGYLKKENVAVTYAQFDLGEKYKIFHKVKYGDNSIWE